MIRVVMMTLVRWDDYGEEMNQVEADQDVADEVIEKVDSGGEAMCSEKNLWFLRGSELVGEQEWRHMKIEYYAEFGGTASHTGKMVEWYVEVWS